MKALFNVLRRSCFCDAAMADHWWACWMITEASVEVDDLENLLLIYAVVGLLPAAVLRVAFLTTVPSQNSIQDYFSSCVKLYVLYMKQCVFCVLLCVFKIKSLHLPSVQLLPFESAITTQAANLEFPPSPKAPPCRNGRASQQTSLTRRLIFPLLYMYHPALYVREWVIHRCDGRVHFPRSQSSSRNCQIASSK